MFSSPLSGSGCFGQPLSIHVRFTAYKKLVIGGPCQLPTNPGGEPIVFEVNKILQNPQDSQFRDTKISWGPMRLSPMGPPGVVVALNRITHATAKAVFLRPLDDQVTGG